MSKLSLIRKIYFNLFKSNHNYDEKIVEDLKRRIELIHHGKKDFYRAYYNYRMSMLNTPKAVIHFLNLFSIGPVFMILLKIYICSLNRKVIFTPFSNKAVFFDYFKNTEVIPKSLYKKYNITISSNNFLFDAKLKSVCRNLLQYWWSPFFILKVILKTSMYNSNIKSQMPKAIITTAEDSFISSILTNFLNELGIQHINVMHGEVLLEYNVLFVRFNLFYLWDNFYIDSFKQMCVEVEEYIIEKPDYLNNLIPDNSSTDMRLTYYLQAQNKDELLKLNEIFLKLTSMGYTIAIRPHPAFYSLIVPIIFKEFEIEDITQMTIIESISRSRYIAAQDSTVLYRAHLVSKKIVIDDLSNANRFSLLVKRRYILFTKEHSLLSEFIGLKVK